MFHLLVSVIIFSFVFSSFAAFVLFIMQEMKKKKERKKAKEILQETIGIIESTTQEIESKKSSNTECVHNVNVLYKKVLN